MVSRKPHSGSPLRRRSGIVAAGALAASATLLLFAASASAATWVIPATSRAFPTTQPGSSRSIAISAAGNEYEGVQVVVRGGAQRAARVSWAEGSDPLIVGNTTLYQVAYVRIKEPSTDAGGKAGDYPDALLPRAFGPGSPSRRALQPSTFSVTCPTVRRPAPIAAP